MLTFGSPEILNLKEEEEEEEEEDFFFKRKTLFRIISSVFTIIQDIYILKKKSKNNVYNHVINTFD